MKRVATSVFFSVLLLAGFVSSMAVDREEPSIVINEVCWSGAAWDSTAEWIELFNLTDEPIDLEGWILASSDGAPYVLLHGVLSAPSDSAGSGYYLLERDNDDAVPGITADLIYRGALSNAGESLSLIDPDGRSVDTANAYRSASEAPLTGWPAGSADPAAGTYVSMERLSFTAPDVPSNWASCILTPTEEDVSFVSGTPKEENSVYNLPPIARITIDPHVPRPGSPARFDASPSSDENDVIATVRWDFGDGATSDEVVVDHTYAEVGVYTVTVTVIDSKGGQAILFEDVQVAESTPPEADFSVRTKSDGEDARAGDALTFQDESFDADGPLVAWAWDLGDGTEAATSIASHVYEVAGDYVVQLMVTDTQGDTAVQTQALTIQAHLPVAVFSYAPDPACTGTPVEFDASESFQTGGTIASYVWDFDNDGVSDAETASPLVEHVYPEGGTYVAQLTVVNEEGDSSVRARAVNVNEPPEAQFQLSTFEPEELEHVSFIDQSWDPDGEIVEWLWTFGDGACSAQQTASHAYRDSGTMTVLLTITDNHGASQTASATVNVQNAPPVGNLSVAETSRPTGSTFTFDASGSFDPSPNGTITTYAWNLGEQAGFTLETCEPILTQTFAEDGQVCVRVRVTDDEGATAVSDPVTITVANRVPTVSQVHWTPAAPVDGEDVTFTVTASDPDGQITGWTWTIDGVQTATQESFTVAFDDDGEYQIAVQVRDNDGGASAEKSVTVSVDNAAPVAAFHISQSPTGVRFDATSSYDPSPSGSIVLVSWDFGDGTQCPGAPPGCGGADQWTPEHDYASPGTYTVTLVVIDEQGAMDREQRSISVND